MKQYLRELCAEGKGLWDIDADAPQLGGASQACTASQLQMTSSLQELVIFVDIPRHSQATSDSRASDI